jgi:hypothetical protein
LLAFRHAQRTVPESFLLPRSSPKYAALTADYTVLVG